MELFGATTITIKIIFEGGANDAPLTVFETTSHCDYDHNGCTDFSQDFTASRECSSYKCQDCKVTYDGVINAINELTASIKEMTSKRGVIPSKRISYPDTPLEIKAAKRRRKDTFKESSIIKKGKITIPLSLSCTDVQCAKATGKQHKLKKVDVTAITEEHNVTVDNSSTASKYKEKVEPQPKVSRNEEWLINIIKGFSILAGLPWHLVDEVYIPINCGDEFHWVLAVIILKERDCGPFFTTYAEYLSDGLQVPNDELDAGLLCKRYAALLWKYREVKAQKSYATNVKDPRRPKPNSVAPDVEQLVHINYIFIA
ncbi:hypothetical protein BC332_14980 [Capsicum chinense]|nr:hypothetical protein BC332_14980 [Capsicum chinense]